MQQTKTYQLNKIDVDDNFSPAPLNENMDKVEAKFAALDGADAALDSRVTVLEAHKLAIGTYVGNGATQTIQLGFTPRFVFAEEKLGGQMFFAIPDLPYRDLLVITDGGFTVSNSSYGYANNSGKTFIYLAVK